jgi:hypothetical protein
MLQQFLAGKLPCLPGELPSYNDWENHLTTIFPEVNHLPQESFNQPMTFISLSYVEV